MNGPLVRTQPGVFSQKNLGRNTCQFIENENKY